MSKTALLEKLIHFKLQKKFDVVKNHEMFITAFKKPVYLTVIDQDPHPRTRLILKFILILYSHMFLRHFCGLKISRMETLFVL